jgi:hypothetical protein
MEKSRMRSGQGAELFAHVSRLTGPATAEPTNTQLAEYMKITMALGSAAARLMTL